MQGTGGYIGAPKGYFETPGRKSSRNTTSCWLTDEIQMGFFRTGKLWAFEHIDATPDIMVFGKALTNGMNPLSGIWAKEALIAPDKFGPGSTHSTFSSQHACTAYSP